LLLFRAANFDELNQHLQSCCEKDVQRQVRGKKESVAELWETDKNQMMPLPKQDYQACVTKPVKVNPYSQVVYETNRYSVPVHYSGKQLVLRIYPFRIEVLYMDELVTEHARCFEWEQDIYNPIHYLPLLEQRPGAFNHAVPLKRWRKQWPKAYEELLEKMQTPQKPQHGIREFIAVLKLHQQYAPEIVAQAIQAALLQNMPHIEVPIQAGNDQVLENMHRGYTNSQYRELVQRIRERIPGVSVATDIIVGFPGETEKQYQDTYGLLSDLKLDVAHLARYSPRTGTVSERRMEDDVPDEEKWRRFRELETLQESIATEIHATYMNKTVPVLFEEKSKKGRWRGRTETNKLVFVENDDDLKGKLLINNEKDTREDRN